MFDFLRVVFCFEVVVGGLRCASLNVDGAPGRTCSVGTCGERPCTRRCSTESGSSPASSWRRQNKRQTVRRSLDPHCPGHLNSPQHRDHKTGHVRNQAGLGARVRVHLRVAAGTDHVRRLRTNWHDRGHDARTTGGRLRRRRERTGRRHAADRLRVAGRRRRWRHEAVRRRRPVFTHLRGGEGDDQNGDAGVMITMLMMSRHVSCIAVRILQ